MYEGLTTNVMTWVGTTDLYIYPRILKPPDGHRRVTSPDTPPSPPTENSSAITNRICLTQKILICSFCKNDIFDNFLFNFIFKYGKTNYILVKSKHAE